MSTLRLSRYEPDHYYFELWVGGKVVEIELQPQCGDFSPADLEDTVNVYDSIELILVCEPDMMERKSDTRRLDNACPTYEEYNNIWNVLMTLPGQYRPALVIAVEEYYGDRTRWANDPAEE